MFSGTKFSSHIPSWDRRSHFTKIFNFFILETFKCHDCVNLTHPCFVCKKIGSEEKLSACSVKRCGKFYHLKCLKPWPQSRVNTTSLICPMHICHTCTSDDPRNPNPGRAGGKLLRCTECPTSFHPGKENIEIFNSTIFIVL